MITVQLKRQKRPKKIEWQLRWKAQGKVSTEGIGVVGKLSRRDGERIRRQKEAALNRGEVNPTPIRNGQMNLEEFAHWHADQIVDLKHGTQWIYRRAFRHLLIALGEHTNLQSLDHAAGDRFSRYLKDQGLMPNTRNVTVCNVAAAWKRAHKAKLIFGGENPFTGRKIKVRQATGQKARVVLTDEQLDAFIEAAGFNPQCQALVFVIARTGVRINEALHLRWTDVDLKRGTIQVVSRARGTFQANGRTFLTPEWGPKTQDAERRLPITADVVDHLRIWKAQNASSPYVFATLDQLAVISQRIHDKRWADNEYLLRTSTTWTWFGRIYANARKILADRRGIMNHEVDFPEPQGWHDLRHTYLTRMARELTGADGIRLLKTIAGHSNIQTTLQYYVHSTPEDEAQVRQALGRITGDKAESARAGRVAG